MSAPSPRRPVRRRPRRGSLERPVNARMYRGTWLIVGLPLLLAAFTVGQPQALPAPALPPAFDEQAALALAKDLADTSPDREPGTQGAADASRWVVDAFRAYGFEPDRRPFTATVPGKGRVELENLVITVTGRSRDAIVVLAHRDDTGAGPGANDNASGTAALVELARTYARRAGPQLDPERGVVPLHDVLLVSTDGGAFGALGAERLATDPAFRDRILAVIVLDSLAGHGKARLQLAADDPRSPAASLVRTAAERVLEETGDEPARPSAFRQLVDLAFPFSFYEQAPFVARGIPAVTLTTAGDRPPTSFTDTADALDVERLGELGRSAQSLLTSIDAGFQITPESSGYLYLGTRTVRGWAVQLVLIAMLLPFLAAAVDLFARSRRRRIPLAPALRSLRSRLLFWLYAGLLFSLLAVLGAWTGGDARPIAPETSAATTWPVVALTVLGILVAVGWLVARHRLVPRRPATPSEQLAGHTAALLALGVLALVVVATNTYGLIFLLPSLHAWLWLPQLSDRSRWVRAALLAAGLLGPMILLGEFAFRFGLGVDAPWYLAALVSVGYVDPTAIVIALAWVAAAAQLCALTAGRYAAYPAARERPPRGPIRETVRRTVLAIRAQRRKSVEEAATLRG
jgi:hypothetical protein